MPRLCQQVRGASVARSLVLGQRAEPAWGLQRSQLGPLSCAVHGVCFVCAGCWEPPVPVGLRSVGAVVVEGPVMSMQEPRRESGGSL